MQLGIIDFSEKHANIGTVVWATVCDYVMMCCTTTLEFVYSNIQISPFGLDSICQFPPNVADMSQHPVWFFEQVLQVPSFGWFQDNSRHSCSTVLVFPPCYWRPLPLWCFIVEMVTHCSCSSLSRDNQERSAMMICRIVTSLLHSPF